MQPIETETRKKSTRFASLDAFRGLTIMLMILVNNPGSWGNIYRPFRHAPWGGCTLTDLVFPFFLFIVGSAMFYSFAKTEFNLDKLAIFRVLKRTALIFAIGLALHAMSSVTWGGDFRVMGVLQRIALAYAGAALVVLFAGRRIVIVGCAVVLLLVYWGALILMGGELPFSLEGNVVRQLDMLIFGAQRMYSVNDIPFDPEGLLSTLPCIASIIIGFEVTRSIASSTNKMRSAFVLAIVGAVFILAGWSWGFLWPVNKSLWSGSFVLLTSGWAMVVWGSLILLMDVGGLRFQMLQAYGMNPLFLYIFSWVWMLGYWWIPYGEGKLAPAVFDIFLAGDAPTKAASFLYAASHVLLFGVFAIVLYKKKIAIKV